MLEERCWPTRKRCTSPSRLAPRRPTDLGGGGRPRLAARRLAALEKANVFVERIDAGLRPDDPPAATSPRRAPTPPLPSKAMLLHWAHADGVASIRLQGGLARAGAAARTAGHALERHARRKSWRRAMAGHAGQRDVAPSAAAGGAQPVGSAASSISPSAPARPRCAMLGHEPAVAPAMLRPGGAAGGADRRPQPVGWHQRSTIESRQHGPCRRRVRAALPAPAISICSATPALVMQREVQSLRTLAGKPGGTDLETMLAAASAGRPIARRSSSCAIESGRLTLAAGGWSEAAGGAVPQPAAAGRWQVEANGARWCSRATDREPARERAHADPAARAAASARAAAHLVAHARAARTPRTRRRRNCSACSSPGCCWCSRRCARCGEAPARIDALDAQLQHTQRLAAEPGPARRGGGVAGPRPLRR